MTGNADIRTLEVSADIIDEARNLRRHLHRHPELAFAEHATAALVAEKLQQWGYEVFRGVGKTGVVGRLRFGPGGRALGLRADMDALPIHEATGLDYASHTAGVMHACGHDGHTAMLLGAAAWIQTLRAADSGVFGSLCGTLHLIFQPAEEKGFDSGASAMIDEGLFERFSCDRIYAMHNLPGVAAGVFWFRDGGFLAAGDRVFITVRGKGGHAARPHQCVDPVVVASSMVMNLQSVVARNLDPEQAAVVTVSQFNAGTASNVIADTAELVLSVRSFDSDVRRLVQTRIEELVHGTARAYGAQADIRYVHGYPTVHNDADASQLGFDVARALFGETRAVRQAPRAMGSEDFAYMLEHVPGAMIRLGNDPAGSHGKQAGLHTPQYDFNDDNLAHGIRFWAALAHAYLQAPYLKGA